MGMALGIDSIRRLDGLGTESRLDVLIVGAGPAGFSASLAAKEHGLRFATIEQDSLGGTVAHAGDKIALTVGSLDVRVLILEK